MKPLWRYQTVTLGHIMRHNRDKTGYHSPTLYVPLAKEVQEQLQEKNLPSVGMKQLTEQNTPIVPMNLRSRA